MLDTRARNKFEYIFDKSSDFFIKCKLKPTHVTVLALIIGIMSAMSYYFDMQIWVTIGLMWFSGFLDAVDGNMARKTNQISKLGTLMDIVFDRIVEISFIISIGLKHADALLSLLFLACSIIISMSVFLTTATLLKNESKKSFHYQSGLMERTEAFIFFTLMFVFEKHLILITCIFATLILFTALQRFLDGKNRF